MRQPYKSITVFIFSLLLFCVFPVFANASTNISVSNNGFGSKNTVTVNNSNVFTSFQSSFSSIFNSIFNNVNTGNNQSNGNTGGSNFIKTGNANSDISVTDNEDPNTISVPEFGIMQGLLAGLISLCGFFVLKKRLV